MNDIKQALATAFDAEPPVRIDRAKLIENGRRRLRRRRMLTASGATLAMTAIVASATMFAGIGQPQQLQPAAPGSVSPAPATPPSSEEIERRFTEALRESHIVPAELTLKATPGSREALRFRAERDQYEASADIADKHGNEGTLYVMVLGKNGNDATPTCAAPNTCDQREFGGRPVQLTTAPLGSQGEVLLMAHTTLPNGVQVYAMTSNVSVKAETEKGKAASQPTTPHHLVTLDQLGRIVGLPELTL